jgi:hypothetical protein
MTQMREQFERETGEEIDEETFRRAFVRYLGGEGGQSMD